MAADVQRIALDGVLELTLPDGSAVRVRPGPYGKGISVIPVGGGAPRTRTPRAPGTGSRGRPPRPSTVELRTMLAKDAGAGHLKDAVHYLDWLAGKEPKVKRTTLQQTVYRELRAVGGGRPAGRRRKASSGEGGRRGRAPHPATVQLREKLAKDKAGGGLQDAAHYIRWLVDKANIGIKQARPIVYRELRGAE